jgi:prophage antirepressor-like protein
MDNLLEFFNYSKNEIIVLMFQNKPWFNTLQICRILKYSKPRKIIRRLVDKKYIKYLKDIVDDYKIYPNAQPKTLFINEFGLYALLLRSKKETATKFYNWVIEDIIPSVINKGHYAIEIKYKNKLEEYQKLLEEQTLRNLILENNQANKHINTKGKYIYIVKPNITKSLNIDEVDILKIGKTTKYKIRIANYNTATKDNTIVLYRVRVNDISAVENYIKALLSKNVYRSRKEYYKVSLYDAIKIIKKCIKLSQSKLISEDKFYKKFILSKSEPLNGFQIQLDNYDETQTGGFYDDEEIKYNDYKYNYVMFNLMMESFRNL